MNKYKKQTLKGVTLAEMLVVMILSGIIFLLVFDGLDIVNKFGRTINNQLNQKLELLSGHQAMEAILEKIDSIRKQDNELLLFNSGEKMASLELDSSRIIFHDISERTDTLFSDIADVRFHFLSEESVYVDSVFLFIMVGIDTLKLNYGLSPFAEFALNNNILDHDDTGE